MRVPAHAGASDLALGPIDVRLMGSQLLAGLHEAPSLRRSRTRSRLSRVRERALIGGNCFHMAVITAHDCHDAAHSHADRARALSFCRPHQLSITPYALYALNSSSVRWRTPHPSDGVK